MLVDLIDALASVEALLPDAQVAVDSAARRLDDLLAEKRGLELALSRHGGGPRTATVETSSGVEGTDIREWALMARTDAARQVLLEADVPLAPKDVVARLGSMGRSDSNNQVRAALAYLKTQGKATLAARGQWLVASPQKSGPEVRDEDPYAVIEVASYATPDLLELPSLNGMGRQHDEDAGSVVTG